MEVQERTTGNGTNVAALLAACGLLLFAQVGHHGFNEKANKGRDYYY